MSDHPRISIYNPDLSKDVSFLRGGRLKIRWDAPVKAIPADSAHDLVRFGGCFYALGIEEAAERYDLEPDVIVDMIADGLVFLYAASPEGEEEVEGWVVLDPDTCRELGNVAANLASYTHEDENGVHDAASEDDTNG